MKDPGIIWPWAVVLLLGGCDQTGSGPETTVEPNAPTYWQDVRPLVARHCLGCHTAGGAGPFAADTLAQVKEHAPLMLGAMQAGIMPPWMPDPDCRRYQGERLMAAADIDLFARWLAAGMPAGDEAHPAPVPAPPAALTPTHNATISSGYVPNAEVSDDYHCFVLDLSFSRDMYLTASQVRPGTSQVHHVLVYAIDPARADRVAAADDAEPGPGYTCFGGPVPSLGNDQASAVTSFFAGGPLPNLSLPAQIGAWVPGAVPRVFPEGQAIRVAAGSIVVAQVHYNLSEGRPLADTTALELKLQEEPPAELLTVRPLAVRDLSIPAGEPAAKNVGHFTYYGDRPLELVSVAGHMHLLGTRIQAEVVRAGGRVPSGSATDDGTAECLLDIPAWDFHWQQSYPLLPDDHVILLSGDGIDVTCTYDNSADHQPEIGGVVSEPKDVVWGEGTTDEMCILYYASVRRFEVGTPGLGEPAPCTGTEGCVAACGESPSLDCVLACAASDATCDLCALRAGLRCSGFACLADLRTIGDCLGTCLAGTVMLGSSTGLCLAAECRAGYDSLLGCADPGLVAPTCASELAACGLAFPATPD